MELPYATTPVDGQGNAWAWLRTASGKTASESQLLELARASILSLWSIPGPYTDDGLGRNGGGAELCDLMVIFGDHVLLFSDKDCTFPTHPDLKIAWSRWYRRAIEKSARQLSGAAAAVRRPGTRLFTDAACNCELPLKLPPAQRMRIHLIAVAHGSIPATERHWERFAGVPGSSGSLFIDSTLVGDAHHEKPFHIGWPLGRDEVVHVLDDHTLPLLLKELDTVADLTDYLAKKEQLLKASGCDFLVPGEEELLTMYLTTLAKGRTHHFPPVDEGALVVLREGSWNEFCAGPLYQARAQANAISYLWDNLIEYQASHVLHGSTEQLFVGNSPAPSGGERLLRVLASENRLMRRSLGATLREGRVLGSQRQRWVCTIAVPAAGRLYCFVFLPYFPDQQNHADYRDYRQYLLYLYCRGALLKFPEAKEVIGIAPDPYDSGIASVDFMMFDVHDSKTSAEDLLDLERQLRTEGIWDANKVRARTFYDVTFPYSPGPVQRLVRSGKRLARKILSRSHRGGT